MLSVSGVVDTVGRVLAGLLMDLPPLRPLRTYLYNACMVGVAGVAFLLPSLHSFGAFVGVACLYACLTGAYVSQKSVIVVDILGVENMANSFGLLILFQGLGTFVGPPLSGALKDHFGTYDEAFYLGGGVMVAAGALMVASNVLLWSRRRRQRQAGRGEAASS